MKRFLLILFLQGVTFCAVRAQSFTVEDLVSLSSQPSRNIDHFMNKYGYSLFSSRFESDTAGGSYIPKAWASKKDPGTRRSIDIYVKNDSKYFTLHTSSQTEFLYGQRYLIKKGFFYDTRKDVNKDTSLLFQKANIDVQANTGIEDSVADYTFKLEVKKIPLAIMYAEELLQFDSHEFLASFFGSQNVKKDMYYFSEKELRKCSVLFSGTRRQAVFVWGDEDNLNNLSYILVTNVLPTKDGANANPLSGNNEWQLQNGIHDGMPIKELLKINEMDFGIYGNESELAFMVKPEKTGKIDFKKTAVMLACGDCFDDKIFRQKEVSALEVAKANLPMRVYDVILYPTEH
jgi:hypothetical protein